ncbi:DNA-binding transcriptional MerR regulator [Nonomuraea polychroma]|uniref:DNA-binding transcriptional MerR regulator n=1 Tax=Nonomuraea polychroma TaxID=46176 RepID=A0A438MHZ1_9ACTN|nr:MerR family transcriptional regulator [Nonomuraea polychroma]RVX45500.1 DNA-binding transcriptional MerR regulator [Nonomuraea polychroma]
MRIGDLAREAGVSPRMLRYYEEQGLLRSQRSSGGHRRYADDSPATVRNIRGLLAAGLPTHLIREILRCVEGPSLADLHPCVRRYLDEQLSELDARISGLQQSRSALASLIQTTAA